MEIREIPKSKWPQKLFEIPQAPKKLWVFGEIPEGENLKYLCVVGTRKFSSYGQDACEKIIAGLKGYPIVIVSGFALGIDTIAHKSAMNAGLPTMVFPGSGLSPNSMYPKTNVKLMEQVVNSGGCFVSEFEPDFKAERWAFPMRNRLMAGVSDAVLIIEGQEKSGTLITARLAVEYNRDVLAIPGSIFAPNSKGPNKLIRQGATPITTPEDVLEALGFEKPTDEEKQRALFEDLSPEEEKILSLLREPMPRDEIFRKIKMPVGTINSLLSIMEIKGIIKEELGEIRLC